MLGNMPPFPKAVLVLRDNNLNVINKEEYNKSVTEGLDSISEFYVWINTFEEKLE